MSQWHLLRNGERQGPFEWIDLRSMALAGDLYADDELEDATGRVQRADRFADLPVSHSAPPPPQTPKRDSKASASSAGKTFEPRTPPVNAHPVRNALLLIFGLAIVDAGWLVTFHRPPSLNQPTTARRPRPPEPVSDEEARAFGEVLVQALNTGLPPDQALVDFEDLTDRILSDLPVTSSFRNSTTAAQRRIGVLSTFRENYQNDISARVLKIHDVDGEKRILLRMIIGPGVNYIDCVVSRSGNQSLRLCDYYSYLTGELLSQSMRSIELQRLSNDAGPSVDSTNGIHRPPKLARNLADLGAAVTKQEFDEALRLYDALPAKLKQKKFVQIMRYQAAAAVLEGEEFTNVVDDIQRLIGHDPRMEMMYINSYIIKKEFARATAALSSLHQDTGDPYLRVVKATVLDEQGETVLAESELLTACREEPALEEAWITLVTLRAKAQKYDELRDTLKRMYPAHREFDYTALMELEDFDDFVETDQYNDWLDFLEAEQARHA